MKLWVTAKVLVEDGSKWELVGVFDSRDGAIGACKDWRHCIWPVNLNEIAPEETTIHPEAEYPLAQAAQATKGVAQ